MKKNDDRWYSLVGWVGVLGEGCTGALLILAPLFTLKLMGVGIMPAEPVFVRFVGIFVFCMGVFYSLPRLSGDPVRRRAAWRTVLLGTGILRVFIAVFTSWAMLTGQLDRGWITLPFYDGTMACLQFILLVRTREK